MYSSGNALALAGRRVTFTGTCRCESEWVLTITCNENDQQPLRITFKFVKMEDDSKKRGYMYDSGLWWRLLIV